MARIQLKKESENLYTNTNFTFLGKCTSNTDINLPNNWNELVLYSRVYDITGVVDSRTITREMIESGINTFVSQNRFISTANSIMMQVNCTETKISINSLNLNGSATNVKSEHNCEVFVYVRN